MDARKAMRRTLPIVLFGAAATVVLRKRLLPRPALPPGEPSAAVPSPADGAAATSAAIAEQSAAVVATAHVPTSRSAATEPPARVESRFVHRLRRAPIDIVTVVDDLLSAAR